MMTLSVISQITFYLNALALIKLMKCEMLYMTPTLSERPVLVSVKYETIARCEQYSTCLDVGKHVGVLTHLGGLETDMEDTITEHSVMETAGNRFDFRPAVTMLNNKKAFSTISSQMTTQTCLDSSDYTDPPSLTSKAFYCIFRYLSTACLLGTLVPRCTVCITYHYCRPLRSA